MVLHVFHAHAVQNSSMLVHVHYVNQEHSLEKVVLVISAHLQHMQIELDSALVHLVGQVNRQILIELTANHVQLVLTHQETENVSNVKMVQFRQKVQPFVSLVVVEQNQITTKLNVFSVLLERFRMMNKIVKYVLLEQYQYWKDSALVPIVLQVTSQAQTEPLASFVLLVLSLLVVLNVLHVTLVLYPGMVLLLVKFVVADILPMQTEQTVNLVLLDNILLKVVNVMNVH